jgi:protein-tyrosine sulfotransferase
MIHGLEIHCPQNRSVKDIPMSRARTSLQQELIRKWLNADWTETDLLDHCQSLSGEKIIAIGGCARSGTTLTRVVLDSHSTIIIGPPTSVFIPIKLDTYDIAFRLALDAERVNYIAATSAGDRVRFIEALALECKRAYNKTIWGDKTARNVHRFDWILRHFPNSRVIHVIRDGRDVVCSLKNHRRRQVIHGELQPLKNEMPLEICIDRWTRSINDGLVYRGDSRYHEIRYEDLVENPEATIKQVCGFLNVPFEDNMLKFHQVKGPLRDPIRFPQNLEATLPLYKTSIGRWRTELTREEQRLTEDAIKNLLIRLNYL